MLFKMVIVLKDWDCKSLLVDVVYVVFVVDFIIVSEGEVMGVLVCCFNIEILGFCLLVVKIVCVMLLVDD